MTEMKELRFLNSMIISHPLMQLVRFHVLTAASMKFRVFWNILPCSQFDIDVSEVRAASIIRAIIALMMEAAHTSETSVDIYFTTRQYIPEDSELHLCSLSNSSS
jgi:hypothetical protein